MILTLLIIWPSIETPANLLACELLLMPAHEHTQVPTMSFHVFRLGSHPHVTRIVLEDCETAGSWWMVA